VRQADVHLHPMRIPTINLIALDFRTFRSPWRAGLFFARPQDGFHFAQRHSQLHPVIVAVGKCRRKKSAPDAHRTDRDREHCGTNEDFPPPHDTLREAAERHRSAAAGSALDYTPALSASTTGSAPTPAMPRTAAAAEVSKAASWAKK